MTITQEEDRDELGLTPLPADADALLIKMQAPPRLVAHLTLVHDAIAADADARLEWQSRFPTT